MFIKTLQHMHRLLLTKVKIYQTTLYKRLQGAASQPNLYQSKS